MPVKSPAQFRLMEAAKAGKLSGVAGPSPAVASEFLAKTPEATKSAFASAPRGASTPRVKKFSSALRRAKRLK